jgi:DNA-binding MarR family transcriptional regulator
MTHTIDRLVERGLIERSAHPTDRRSMLISLTPHGHELIAEIQAARRGHFEALCDPLTREELDQLVTLFDKMMDPSRAPARPSQQPGGSGT